MPGTKKNIVLLSILLLPLLNGCLLTVHDRANAVAFDDSAPTYRPGPPAHAKAYGYRNNHNYYYYPSSNVYLDTDRDVYFYLDSRGAWEMSVSLPQTLYVGLGDHVTLEMGTDQPYRKNYKHKKRYQRRKKKKKNNK